VVELLMWEITAISHRKWEDLPGFKAKKEALAGRLRQYDWTPDGRETEPLDLVMLRSQISDLEYQSRKKVQVQLQTIKSQLGVLEDRKKYWLECFNSYFRQPPVRA
jgi:hypothetical protein